MKSVVVIPEEPWISTPFRAAGREGIDLSVSFLTEGIKRNEKTPRPQTKRRQKEWRVPTGIPSARNSGLHCRTGRWHPWRWEAPRRGPFSGPVAVHGLRSPTPPSRLEAPPEETPLMSPTDKLILLLYLLMTLGIGWAARTREDRADTFFLAGRRMGWFPIGLSVMVTVFSAINYVALPGEVFGYGLYVTASFPVFFLAAWPITQIWIPFFHEMRLTSVYEYFERRFDVRVRVLASGLFIFWRLFWMATALYASGNILGALTGLPATLIILAGGLVAAAYTAIGGMRAVMWTDVAQFCVLFGGIVMGLLMASGGGGLGAVFQRALEGGRLKPFVPFDPEFLSPNPFVRMTLWSGFLGVFVAFLARYGADQVVIQRYFTARGLRSAQRGLWFNALAAVISLSLLTMFGLAIYAWTVSGGGLEGIDWARLAPAQQNALLMRNMAELIRSFPFGITGLVMAGLFAATMSSIDSGIHACSTAYITDFHHRFVPNSAREARRERRLDRFLTVGLGALVTAMALLLIPLVEHGNSLFMIVNKMINGLGSPLLALFLCGMFTRRSNAPGVFYGGIVGLVLSLAVSLAIKGLALQYYAVVNLLAALVPCLLFSRLAEWAGTRQPPEKLAWSWLARRRAEPHKNESRDVSV